MRLRTLAWAVLLLATPALADEFDGKATLSTEQKAEIQADQDEAHKKIDEQYKGDDSAEARVAKQHAYEDADQQVLDKHGVDKKDYFIQSLHDAPSEQKEIREQSAAIEKKRKADAEAAKNKPAAAPEVVRGFDANHPLDVTPGGEKPKLDAKGNPIPQVEQLNPADDPNAGMPVPNERPSRRASSHRRHHRR